MFARSCARLEDSIHWYFLDLEDMISQAPIAEVWGTWQQVQGMSTWTESSPVFLWTSHFYTAATYISILNIYTSVYCIAGVQLIRLYQDGWVVFQKLISHRYEADHLLNDALHNLGASMMVAGHYCSTIWYNMIVYRTISEMLKTECPN